MPELKASEALAQNGHTEENGNGHEPNKGGRETKLTKKVIDRLCKALRGKNPLTNACKLAGISYTTFKNWRNEALLGTDPAKVAFLANIEKALADAQESMIKCVANKAREDWKAAAFILERRHPDEWGRKDFIRSEVSGPGGKPIEQKVETVERPVDEKALENFVREIIKERDTKPAVETNGNGR